MADKSFSKNPHSANLRNVIPKNEMEELIAIGRKRTILISISILLVSIHTIYFYHAVRPEIEISKLTQQGVRFLLTIGLIIFTYKGKKWAKIASIVLYSLAILGALIVVTRPFADKISLIVMIIVYSMAVYHLGFSKSYKSFFEYQNRDQTEF